MREMSIVVVCDRCETTLDADGTEPGTPIMFRNSGELTVDLCEECEEELYEDLKPLLTKGLRPQTRKPGLNGNGSGRKPIPPRTPLNCPSCGKAVSVGAGMTLHARKVHPDEADELIEESKRLVSTA